MDAQFLEDVVYVVLDCRYLDVEARADLLIGKPLVDQVENLHLARRDADALRAGRWAVCEDPDMPQKRARDPR